MAVRILWFGVLFLSDQMFCIALDTNYHLTTVVYPISVGDMDPTHPCLTEALQNINSGTRLVLQSGTHTVTADIVVSNISDVTIAGMSDSQLNVNITCSENKGLVFTECKRLVIMNLTITGCGLSGQSLTYIASVIPLCDLHISSSLRISLLIANSWNFTMENSAILKTNRLGLMAITLDGGSIILNTILAHNRKDRTPTTPEPELAGGGAYVLYCDYHNSSTPRSLTLFNCEFRNNSDLSLTGYFELYLDKSAFLQESEFPVGGSGGLTVIMQQTIFSVRIEIVSSVFEDNTAVYGGAAHLAFHRGIANSSVVLDSCVFSKNGDSQQSKYGGAMFIIFDAIKRDQLGIHQNKSYGVTQVALVNSNFTMNQAMVGGAVYIHSKNQIKNIKAVTFVGCYFMRNQAHTTLALLAFEDKLSGLTAGLKITLDNCELSDNIVEGGHLPHTNVVSFQHVNVTIAGISSLSNNEGSAVSGIRAVFTINGELHLIGNGGVFGGGMQLLDGSILIMQRNSKIRFINNTAEYIGGAIYAEPGVSEYSKEECFLYFDHYDVRCGDSDCHNIIPTVLSTNFYFQGNVGRFGGAVHGLLLGKCYWSESIINHMACDVYVTDDILTCLLNRSVFEYSRSDGSPLISADVSDISVSTSIPEEVMPGQKFEINLISHDQLGNPAITTVTSEFFGDEREFCPSRQSIHGGLEGRARLLDGFQCHSTPIAVKGLSDTTQIVSISSIDSDVSYAFNITLTKCLLGYKFDTTGQFCYCDPKLAEMDIKCDVNNVMFTVPHQMWLGPVTKIDGSETLGIGSCSLNYCRTGTKEVAVTYDDFDFQCANDFHRTGVICGSCEEGYSVVLGSSRCQQCSNNYLLMIPVYLTGGIFLIVVMFILQITISEGYLIPVLFYSNIVSLFSYHLTPSLSSEGPFVITAILSLKPGIEMCFYNGMTNLVLYTFSYLYVAYLFILVLLISLLGRCFKIPGAESYSPAKVLTTLMIMCYTLLLDLCVSTLAFSVVEILNDDTVHLRWYIDPSLPYFQGSHAVLCVVAIVIVIVYIIPFPLLVLFPCCISKFKLYVKLKPLYDVIWAPFKPRFRWMVGFRLLMRWISYALALFVPFPHNLFALGLFLTILHFLQTALSPFKSTLLNVIDSFLLANMILLVMGGLFTRTVYVSSVMQTVFSSLVVTSAYVVFVGTFAIHLRKHFPKLNKDIQDLLTTLRLKFSRSSDTNSLRSHDSNEELVTFSEISMETLNEDVELREELLEDTVQETS